MPSEVTISSPLFASVSPSGSRLAGGYGCPSGASSVVTPRNETSPLSRRPSERSTAACRTAPAGAGSGRRRGCRRRRASASYVMLESPPTVVPANVVPVGTIACPRNSSDGGLEPSLAFADGARAPAAIAVATAKATIALFPMLIAPSLADVPAERVPQPSRVSRSRRAASRGGATRVSGPSERQTPLRTRAPRERPRRATRV